jgi:hypothetical protein
MLNHVNWAQSGYRKNLKSALIRLMCVYLCGHLQTLQNIYNIVDPPAFRSQVAGNLVQ